MNDNELGLSRTMVSHQVLYHLPSTLAMLAISAVGA